MKKKALNEVSHSETFIIRWLMEWLNHREHMDSVNFILSTGNINMAIKA